MSVDPKTSAAESGGAEIAVKGGVGGAGMSRGPIRMPILAGAAAPAPAASSQAAPQPAAKPGPPRAEISSIRGLNDDSRHESMATALSHHMFDSARDRQTKSFKIVLLLLVVALVLALVFVPGFRQEATRLFGDARTKVRELVRPPRKPRKRSRDVYIDEQPAAAAAASEGPAPSLVNIKGSCGAMIKAVSASDTRLTPAERVAVAECFLAYDNPQSAEEMLTPLKRKLKTVSEVSLNAQKSTGTLADAQQLLVVTYIKMGKTREAEELMRGRCRRWEQSNTCVAKLLLHANRHYDATAMKGLFETHGRLDRKAQARLWHAGALLALQENRPGVADQRFAMALGAAPKDALALRKWTYEMQAIDLYRRGEVIKLKSLVAAAQADLSRFDGKAKIKLAVLGELVGSSDRRRTLKKLLTREDVTYRARTDLDLIDILGPESLRYGLEPEYLRLLGRTRAQYGERFRASAGALKRLALWEIRATCSLKSYEQALQLLGRYENGFGREPVIHHLRGMVELYQDPSPKYALLAAAEFQQAIRARGGWESLYALGVALLRGGKPEQVPAVIKDLERSVATPSQRFWTDMLKAQWYLAMQKYVNAAKILQDWTKKEPGYSVPRELLMDVFAKMGNKSGAEEQERVLDDLRRRHPGGKTPEAFASPLGLLAYERRSID